MDPKNKQNIENQKKMALKNLETQRAFLKEKGAGAEEIKKNTTIRKLNADIRKADYRLACIAAQEKKAQDLAQAKAEKLAAAKVPKEKKKKEVKEAAPPKKGEKGKGEKKTAPAAKKDK
jgi:hypothetical protein